MNADHGNFYDVGSRALYWGVYGVALSKVAHGGVARVDVGQVASAVEEGLGVTLLSCCLLGRLHVELHLGEGLEVAVDELLSLVARDLKSLSQTEHRYAVYYAEVGTFGLCALVACDAVNGLLIYLCCRGGVNVVAFAERLYHVVVAAEVCHDAQLDLRIVGREEELSRLRHEATAYLLAVFSAHGYVLEVGVRG